MRAFMSSIDEGPSTQVRRANTAAALARSPECQKMAVQEARRILAETEPPSDATGYTPVRWIAELRPTLDDNADALTRYGAALAEALDTFINRENS